jgi:hypothetical protein
MMVLGRVALFRKELRPLSQFSKSQGAASQRLRELLAQQLLMLSLRQQCDRVTAASAFLPMALAFDVRVANPPDARTWDSLNNPCCPLYAHRSSLHAVLANFYNCCTGCNSQLDRSISFSSL